MAGNYNNGNNYSISEQARFGSIMAQSLEDAKIPWSINADNKFYDFVTYDWFLVSDNAGVAVRDAILSPRSACLYSGLNYSGGCLRLAEGSYSRSDLNTRGFVALQSVMVPFGYKLIVTIGTINAVENIYLSTIANISANNVSSVQVVKI